MSGTPATPPTGPFGGDGDYNWADGTNNWTDVDATFLQERALVRFDDTSATAPTAGTPPDGTPANLNAGRVFVGRVKGTLVMRLPGSVWRYFLGSRYLKNVVDTPGSPSTAEIVASGAATTGVKFTDGSNKVTVGSLSATVRSADSGSLTWRNGNPSDPYTCYASFVHPTGASVAGLLVDTASLDFAAMQESTQFIVS